VTVDGKAVPAGSYTLFTVPKQTRGRWSSARRLANGNDYPGEKEDLLRVPMKVSKNGRRLKISDRLRSGRQQCKLRMEWETTVAASRLRSRNCEATTSE